MKRVSKIESGSCWSDGRSRKSSWRSNLWKWNRSKSINSSETWRMTRTGRRTSWLWSWSISTSTSMECGLRLPASPTKHSGWKLGRHRSWSKRRSSTLPNASPSANLESRISILSSKNKMSSSRSSVTVVKIKSLVPHSRSLQQEFIAQSLVPTVTPHVALRQPAFRAMLPDSSPWSHPLKVAVITVVTVVLNRLHCQDWESVLKEYRRKVNQ